MIWTKATRLAARLTMVPLAAAQLAAVTPTTAPPAAAPPAAIPPAAIPPAAVRLAARSPAAFDTTFAIAAGARVEIENYAGTVVVRTWNRAEVRVVASRSEPGRVKIRNAGAMVRIESDSPLGPGRIVDYEVTIPASAPIRISGPFTDVTVEGAGADVAVETVKGDVRVRGGNGQISLRSVEGAVSLDQARGRISLAAVNDGIRATQLDGEITAETINGNIRLEAIRSANVSASTINGTLSYSGTIRDQGRYAFTTHNGDLVLVVPDGTNAAVSIATFNGRIESALQVTLTEVRRGQRFQFTIGNGSARIELESFNGTVHLKRPSGAQT